MDEYKLFKQIKKLSKFKITGHNKNPPSTNCLNTSLMTLISSVEKNFANSIENNLVFSL